MFLLPYSFAGVDPSIHWQVLQTDHFEIIYDKTQKSLAEHYAHYAELSYVQLKNVFSELPDKTTIVIDDSTDQANGFAGFFPYPLIKVFPVLPNSQDSISDYELWAFELILHEYTHILTFQPAHGMYTPLKYIFGSIVRPNAILPRWWQEGLAVEMESRFTTKGRLRSPATSANLRALAYENKLSQETIDRINETDIFSYPYGQRPYLFGSLLWREITALGGSGVADKLVQRHSRRLPFMLTTPLVESIGQRYDNLLLELFQKIQLKAQDDMKAITSAGIDKAEEFAHSGTHQVGPVISPNGRYLAYIAYEPFSGAEVRLIERDPAKGESFRGLPFRTLKKGKSFLRLGWLPDSENLIYDKLDVYDRRNLYRDLYQLHIPSQQETRLTKGARAHEPSVSPNGQQVVFVQFLNQQNTLVLLDLKTGSLKTLFQAPSGSRVSTPEFIDVNRVVFTGHSPNNGTEKLYVLNLRSGLRTPLLESFKHASQAQHTSKGLLFTSNQTGVRNLYLADKQLTQAQAISNTTTEAFNGDIDPLRGELISSRLTAGGRKLFASASDKTFKPPQVTPVNRQDFPLPPRTLATPEVTSEIKDYQPLKYLVPRYWLPFVYPSEEGVIIQGATANSDPLQKNYYILEGSYDTSTSKASYLAAYTNSSTPIDLNLSFSEYNEFFGASSTTLTSRYTRFSGDFFLPGLSEHWRAEFGGVRTETELTSATLTRQGPTAQIAYSNFEDDGGYFSGGWGFSLNHTEYLEGENLLSYGRTYLALSTQLRNPLPTRHSFKTHMKAVNAPHLPFNQVVTLGEKTSSANYFVSLLNTTLLMRGYPSATFSGRQIVNVNLEYNFPVKDIFSGWGLKPLFLKNLEGTLFADGVALEGRYYDIDRETYLLAEFDRQFYSSGLEFNLNTTFAYHLPLTFTLGLYYGFDERAGGGFTTFFGIGYSGIEGLGIKNRARSE